MSDQNIQEQFDGYLELLNKIHNIGHEIDASINEVEIQDLYERRSRYSQRLKVLQKKLMDNIESHGSKQTVTNRLSNQEVVVYVANDRLVFEYGIPTV